MFSRGLPRLCVTIRKEHRQVVVSNFQRCKGTAIFLRTKENFHVTHWCTSKYKSIQVLYKFLYKFVREKHEKREPTNADSLIFEYFYLIITLSAYSS